MQALLCCLCKSSLVPVLEATVWSGNNSVKGKDKLKDYHLHHNLQALLVKLICLCNLWFELRLLVHSALAPHNDNNFEYNAMLSNVKNLLRVARFLGALLTSSTCSSRLHDMDGANHGACLLLALDAFLLLTFQSVSARSHNWTSQDWHVRIQWGTKTQWTWVFIRKGACHWHAYGKACHKTVASAKGASLSPPS